MAKAEASDKRVEVASRRTDIETYWANPDGSVTRETSLAPIRAKNADDKWAPIDTTLSEQGERIAPKNTTGAVSFSGSGTGELATFDLSKDASFSMSFAGQLDTPAVEGSSAVYRVKSTPTDAPDSVEPDGAQAEGESGTAIQVTPYADGFASRVLLSADPGNKAEYRFALKTKGLTPSLENGALELRDPKDKLIARSRPFQMWDSRVDEAGDPSNLKAVDSKLERTESGYDLVLSPSTEFLTDPKTKYPVTIDPDVATVTNKGDTWYYEGQLSGSPRKDEDYRLLVGKFSDGTKARSFISFSYKSYLGTNVSKATLSLKQYQNGAANCDPEPTYFFPMMGNDSSSPWWGNQPTVDFTDGRFYTKAEFNHGVAPVTGCAMARESIDVTPMVNGWAGEHFGKDFDRQGMVMRAEDETDVAQNKRFCSQDFDPTVSWCADASVVPTLSVTYLPDLGVQAWYSMTDHQLNKMSGLAINNKNGNLVVSTGDANVKGVGLDLSVGRTYNSQAETVGSIGKGWNLSIGPDVWLEKKSNYRYDFHGPNGTVLGSFVRSSKNSSVPGFYKFKTPTGGSGADLDQDSSSGKLTLAFHGSQTKYVFTINGSDSNGYLTELRDRSGNKITFTYGIGSTPNTHRPKLASLKDSSGRDYTVTYGTGTSADYITKIASTVTDVPRDWEYAYNANGYLTSYEDPSGAVTTYAYDSFSAGPDKLETITDPANQSGKHPETTIVYEHDGDLDVDQVTEVDYRYGDGSTDHYKYTWDYRDSTPSDCEGNGDVGTVVKDPNTHDTTYCFRSRTDTGVDSKTWVYDAKGHAKSTEYNADQGPTNVTDPTGQSAGPDGSTSADYAGPDQLTKLTAPKSDAAQNATTGFQYGAATTSDGGKYLPTEIKNSSGDCNRFGYDGKGRTTDSYTGLVATKDDVSTCDTSGGDVKGFHRKYDGDTGNVLKSWDDNSGSTTSTPPSLDSKATIYTYYPTLTTDPDYHAGSQNQLKSIRKPGGDCSSTVAAGRKLCTTFTYDQSARVSTVTNGRGKVTTYARDKMDRVTGVFFDGSTSCDVTGSNCFTYTYDDEGNLTSRSEALLQASQFGYDRLNRAVVQYNPTGLLQPSDAIGIAYDGVGNLTIYDQQIGSAFDGVAYVYDSANRLTNVYDSTGSIEVDSDADGRTTGLKFPAPSGSDGMKVGYEFSKTGKPDKLKVEEHDDDDIATIEYSYIRDLYLGTFKIQVETSQMQHRTVTGNLSNLNSSVAYDYFTSGELKKADASSGTDYVYEYDQVSNITKETVGSTDTNYGYDRAGELCWKGPNSGAKLSDSCGAAASGNTTVTSDEAGNGTGTTADPATYNAADQLTAIGGTSMTYRDQGNNVRATTGSTRVLAGPTGITATVTGSNVTFYTRDPQGTILNAHDGTNTVNYVTEFNGSVAAIFTPAGAPVGSYKYAPYGDTHVDDETGTTQADANRFRYISGYQDTTSTGADGSYKLGARFYDARGHFTQPDSIAGSINDPKSLTAYNYAGGDPVNASDPSGLSLLESLGKVADVFDVAEIIRTFQSGDIKGGFIKSASFIVGSVTTTLCIGFVTAGPQAVTAPEAFPTCAIAGGLAGKGTELAGNAAFK